MTAAPPIAGPDLGATVRRVAGAGHSSLQDASTAADARHVPRRAKEPA